MIPQPHVTNHKFLAQMARLVLVQAVALAALLCPVSGHMFMVEPPSYVDSAGNGPVIYPLYSPGNPGPGDAPQNTFPCQGLSVAQQYTQIAAGGTVIVQLGSNTDYA